MCSPNLLIDEENRRLVCGLCFKWFSFDDLFVDSEGQKWDFCKPCAVEELLDARRSNQLEQG